MNACTAVGEKLKYESLDVFLATIKAYQRSNGHRLQMWKADIDSAFRCALARCCNDLCCCAVACRRIPLLPEHRQYAWIAFRHDGQIRLAKHLTCMFGAASSVHNWERVGERPAIAMPSVCNAPATRTAAEGPGKKDTAHPDLQVRR